MAFGTNLKWKDISKGSASLKTPVELGEWIMQMTIISLLRQMIVITEQEKRPTTFSGLRQLEDVGGPSAR